MYNYNSIKKLACEVEWSFMSDVYVEKSWNIIREELKGLVLDIGSRDGVVTWRHKNSIGVDIEPAPVCFIPTIKGRAENLPFKDRVFDTIVMNHVLEHFENPSEILKEVHRVLKDGGKLIVCVPNKDSYTSIIKGRKYSYVYNIQHKFYFNLPVLRAQIITANFEIQCVRGTVLLASFFYKIFKKFKFLRKLYMITGDLDKKHAKDLIVIARKI